MWGSPESVQEVKALVTLIESVQAQQQASGAPVAGAATLGEPAPIVTNSGGGGSAST